MLFSQCHMVDNSSSLIRNLHYTGIMNPFKDILGVLVTLCLIKSGEECVVFVVRVVAKAQRQDQEVCALCLESLCHLVPLLQSKDDMVTRCVSESRNDALILLSAFL